MVRFSFDYHKAPLLQFTEIFDFCWFIWLVLFTSFASNEALSTPSSLLTTCLAQLSLINWKWSYRLRPHFGNSFHFFEVGLNHPKPTCYTWRFCTNISNKSTFLIQLSMCNQFASAVQTLILDIIRSKILYLLSPWANNCVSFNIFTCILVSEIGTQSFLLWSLYLPSQPFKK